MVGAELGEKVEKKLAQAAKKNVEDSGAFGSDRGHGAGAAILAELEQLRRENRSLKIAVAELERIVDRDTLTPLFNRRYFMNALIKRQARLVRHNEPSALLFVDVDGLKAINDTHGHGVGDFVLIKIAEILSENVRSTDTVARIGGDEFALILDHVDLAGAREKAAKLTRAIEAKPALYNDLCLPMRASIGFIMVNSSDSEDALMARADSEMYRVKLANRR